MDEDACYLTVSVRFKNKKKSVYNDIQCKVAQCALVAVVVRACCLRADGSFRVRRERNGPLHQRRWHEFLAEGPHWPPLRVRLNESLLTAAHHQRQFKQNTTRTSGRDFKIKYATCALQRNKNWKYYYFLMLMFCRGKHNRTLSNVSKFDLFLRKII